MTYYLIHSFISAVSSCFAEHAEARYLLSRAANVNGSEDCEPFSRAHRSMLWPILPLRDSQLHRE